jgi:hypothetical protein
LEKDSTNLSTTDLPRGLDGIYNRYFKRKLDNSPAARVDTCRLLLLILACGRCTKDQLFNASRIGFCMPLLAFEAAFEMVEEYLMPYGDHSYYCFFHSSIADWLQSSSSCYFAQPHDEMSWRSQLQMGHRVLAATSLLLR